MSATSIWWIIAGILVSIELLSGTFYLLMLALGFSAAAIASYWNTSPQIQLAIAAMVGGGAVIGWYVYQKKNSARGKDSPFNLDMSSSVYVAAWRSDGTASVYYRGSHWDACAAFGEKLVAGQYRIQGITGNRLILERIESRGQTEAQLN